MPRFVSDDFIYVGTWARLDLTLENIIYYFKTPVLFLHSPLVMFSFMVDNLLWGKHFALGANITNMLLHAASAILFLKLLTVLHFYQKGKKSLRIPLLLAAAIALLWALHPQRAESVAWISERKDTLVTFFFLISALSFIKSFREKKFDIAGTAVLILSFLCKPMLITFPALAAIFIFAETRGKNFFKNLKYIIPSAVVSAGYFIINSKQMSESQRGTLDFSGLMTIAATVGRYFKKVFYPFDLATHYPESMPQTDMFLLLIVIIILILMLKSKWKNFSLYCLLPCIMLFGAAISPVSGIINVGSAVFADRYNYIPSLFIASATGFILAALIERYNKAQLAVYALAGIVIILFCAETNLNCKLYRDDNKFFENAISQPKPHSRILFAYGYRMLNEQRYDEAERVANIFNTPDAAGTTKETFRKTVLALVNIKKGNIDYGLAELDKIIFSKECVHLRDYTRNFAKDCLTLAARLHLRKGNMPQAAEIFRRLSLFYGIYDPAEGEFYLGVRAMIQNRFAEAEKHFGNAAKARPDNQNFKLNYLEARKRQGKL